MNLRNMMCELLFGMQDMKLYASSAAMLTMNEQSCNTAACAKRCDIGHDIVLVHLMTS